MNALHFEEFELGRQWTTQGRTVTEADVVAFAALSGDANPLHVDAEYARTTPFGERIAHGVLGLSIATGLISKLGIIEGTTIAFLGLEWSFKAPIVFGDTITVRYRVADKRETSKPDRGIVSFVAQLVNQRGEVVQEGKQTLLMRRR
ncbi:MAG: MaoC family dehydratase N-terminal domain-containing protein [Gaiellaceae bacterium MAG52_C11]|nr:MaoC family dehydratase N-terminal domain-containing protein [Candidatus Gaiellasilicea maunaloa]